MHSPMGSRPHHFSNCSHLNPRPKRLAGRSAPRWRRRLRRGQRPAHAPTRPSGAHPRTSHATSERAPGAVGSAGGARSGAGLTRLCRPMCVAGVGVAGPPASDKSNLRRRLARGSWRQPRTRRADSRDLSRSLGRSWMVAPILRLERGPRQWVISWRRSLELTFRSHQ
jgi:hypothetical protein